MTAVLESATTTLYPDDDAEEIHVMECPDGHTITWRESAADEVIAARDAFDLYHGQGYLAYAPDADNIGGSQLHRFDATVPRILYTDPLMGG